MNMGNFKSRDCFQYTDENPLNDGLKSKTHEHH